MNDPRDFLAFTRYGNLGVLLLGIGLLGVLIHRKPARQTIAAGVSLLGILLICEGSTLLHGATLSLRGSTVAVLIAAGVSLGTVLTIRAKSDANKQAT
ncbi:MAG: hypothetical protein HQ518_27140 [Rhodopirellula sp.]|nr:hypothetical protein [Rhodopirellula sp.]